MISFFGTILYDTSHNIQYSRIKTFIEDKNKIVVKLLYGKTDSNNIVKCLTHI